MATGLPNYLLYGSISSGGIPACKHYLQKPKHSERPGLPSGQKEHGGYHVPKE